MDLRGTPQAVSVLYARICFRSTVRFADLATLVQVRQIASRSAGAGIFARVHDARIERARAAAKRIKRKRSGDVSGVGKNVGVAKRETQQRQHALRAVL